MRQAILIITFLALIPNPLNAHTCENEKVKCPIDGNKVSFCVTMSMTTFGAYRDFQKKGAVGNHYEQLVNSCSKCRFSGSIDDFKKKYDNEELIAIKKVLEKYASEKMNDGLECKVAGEIQEILRSKNKVIMFYYQTGSYVTRGNKFVELRKELQKKTIQSITLAIEANEYEDKSVVANLQYLIGDLNRRVGNFDEAIKYYDLAIANPDKKDWVERVASEQKELALKKDADNDI